MRDTKIRWEHINAETEGHRLFDKYCCLNSNCKGCNKRVRFWCNVKERLIQRQEKIIREVLNKRWCSDNEKET